MKKSRTQTEEFWQEWRKVVRLLLSLGVDLGRIKIVWKE